MEREEREDTEIEVKTKFKTSEYRKRLAVPNA
jgi:hypothetical protein